MKSNKFVRQRAKEYSGKRMHIIMLDGTRYTWCEVLEVKYNSITILHEGRMCILDANNIRDLY